MRVGPAPAGATAHGRPKVLRTWTAWSSTIFFGIQTLLFYATLAWLPSILVAAGAGRRQRRKHAGAVIVGVAGGGLVAPILAAASADQRPHILAIVALCAAGFAGLLIAPTPCRSYGR